MDQIITFDKSLQTRLQEYEEVFSGLATLPYSKIQSEWAYYLELTLDPNGWQAVWKIPRLKCEEMKIPFPTFVLVFVHSVNYADLTALVRILAVQDEIHLPEKHYVPLIQLWPTKEQDRSIALNINATANCLDMLRFFYIYVLMPWDEDDDCADWKGANLVSRLRLFYDLKNGKIPKGTSEHIHALLNEARRLNSKRQLLINICDDKYDSDVERGNDQDMEHLIEINVRLIEIQNEMHLLENEMFRKIIIKRQQSTEVPNKTEKENSQIWLICKNVKASEYITFVKAVEELHPNESLTFGPDLMLKLESANSHDTILLSRNKHDIKSQGALIENFTIKGIGNDVEILSLAEDVMFDCIGDSSQIENITFDCKNTRCSILVRKGEVTIKNCKIIGDSSSTTHQGFLVLNGAKLTLTECEIEGFATAVVGNSGSTVIIKDSIIEGASVGVKVYDNCQLVLNKNTIKNCKEYGVMVQTDQDYSSDRIVGGSETMDLVSHFTVESLKLINNQKGDVIIKKLNIKAMEDLFANPDLDPTILEFSDDDDMETSQENLNSTVLENIVG